MTSVDRITESELIAIREIRRDLHANPELGFDLPRTAAIVAKTLRGWGISVVEGVGGSGVVGILRNGTGSRSLGLRADMDALPIFESNTFAHRSTSEGMMHACGHDGHTAILLGAAQQLAKHKTFDGTVYFIFQPAEEVGTGARAMINDGLFERFPVDAVFGLHNWPGLEEGKIAIKAGPVMASTSRFRITIRGHAYHGAMPHQGHDVVLTLGHLVTALQSIVARNISPIEPAVLSVTQCHAGSSDIAGPSEAWISGTVRTFDDDITSIIETRLRTIANRVCEMADCSAETEFKRGCPATINSVSETKFALRVAKEIAGAGNVVTDMPPTMGGEDFAFMLQKIPGCFVFLGNGGVNEQGLSACELHNDGYDFNDAILPLGITYFTALVERHLAATLKSNSAKPRQPFRR